MSLRSRENQAPAVQAPEAAQTVRRGVRRVARAVRGATMVEYALLIVAVMLLAAFAYRNLGKSVRKNADETSAELIKRGN